MPRRDRQGTDPYRLDLNLTPLLDVVLQLITFFMMLVHFGTAIEAAEREVRLPVAPSALPGAMTVEDRMVVVVDEAGTLIAGGRALDASRAPGWWGEQARRRLRGTASLGDSGQELPTQVIVRADRDAPYGSVRSTLAEAQRAGFARFSLVVLTEEAAP
ncbi:ExbD/TolR family protein [Tautonia plasticadhaerens]|uniref:Biopolymer transport protein ExbD/TolR n=1 Tax=Tautonia plasticadhaerens TaxID=2527974 RepID=A0A518H2T5_9BACT|nr:biopolymer transporter ExbD [Tautonia plasticadhaerens]QDV35141.1 Biopolymer transport protein ExbD/TolR [Tautonia plasticadhaerens]